MDVAIFDVCANVAESDILLTLLKQTLSYLAVLMQLCFGYMTL